MKIKDINDLAVMIVSLVLAIVLLLTGCGADTVNNNVENKDNYEANYMQEYYSFNFYVDDDDKAKAIAKLDRLCGNTTKGKLAAFLRVQIKKFNLINTYVCGASFLQIFNCVIDGF